jgi:hypothetical protein
MASIEEYDIMKDIFRNGSASHRSITHLVTPDAYLLQALDAEIAFPSLVEIDICLKYGVIIPPLSVQALKVHPIPRANYAPCMAHVSVHEYTRGATTRTPTPQAFYFRCDESQPIPLFRVWQADTRYS